MKSYEPNPEFRDLSIPLMWDQLDSRNFIPSPELVGALLTHTGNEKQYTVIAFTWLGATDEWGFVAREIGAFGETVTRPLSHLCGNRRNGEPRYQEAGDWTQYAVYE